MAGGVIFSMDPGTTGAIAKFDDEGNLLAVFDMPVYETVRRYKRDGEWKKGTKRHVDPDGIRVILENRGNHAAIAAVIEGAHARLEDGPMQAFQIGFAAGVLHGAAGMVMPIRTVAPQTWKRHFNLLKAGDDAPRQMALEFWPAHRELFKRKMDHNRAEAALLGRWHIDTADEWKPEVREEPHEVEFQPELVF